MDEVFSELEAASILRTSVKSIKGNWDLGFVLDKHTLSSVPIGPNQYGHMQFDTKRSEVGEALFQLKYRQDWTQVPHLAKALATVVYPKFLDVGLLIPMPASNVRKKQPVTELTKGLGSLVDVPVFDGLLTKESSGKPAKDLATRAEKLEALEKSFRVHDLIEGQGPWNALLVEDLYDTGASLEAACKALRGFRKIKRLYVAALTWK